MHGPLTSPGLITQDKINASVLVLHGWEDAVAKPQSVLDLAAEMTRAQADWQLHSYGHAKHAFIFVGADIPSLGIKYDEKAHQRSKRTIDS